MCLFIARLPLFVPRVHIFIARKAFLLARSPVFIAGVSENQKRLATMCWGNERKACLEIEIAVFEIAV
jgi:hypothetical protein